MKLKLFASIVTFIGIISCNNTQQNAANATQDSVVTDNHELKESEEIELNNGEKWKVDEPMMALIKKMEKDVISFKKTEINNYAILAKSLKITIDSLTSNCTMEGRAHDELHKWLLPFIDLVDEFKNNLSNVSLTNKNYKHLIKSFETLNKHFI